MRDTDQALAAARLARGRCGRRLGAALYRQRRGDNRDRVVDPGFAQEEDVAFKKIVADYEKASGNTIDYSIVPFAPLRQKIISAMTSGAVPDVIDGNPIEVVALQAWDGKLVDVSDVVETQKARIMPSALLGARCYNNVEKRRSFYGVPYKGRSGHSIIGGTWSKRRATRNRTSRIRGMLSSISSSRCSKSCAPRGCATSLPPASCSVPSASSRQHLRLVPDRLWRRRPGHQGRQAPCRRSKGQGGGAQGVDLSRRAYKEGYVPPGTVNWNDADDNNAFHSKLCVMDLDGTLSTEVAMIHDKQAITTTSWCTVCRSATRASRCRACSPPICALIPKGAKNVEVAKDFLGIPDPAQGQRRLFEGRARPVSAGDAGTRQERPVVDRPQAGPAPAALCAAGVRRTDHPLLLGRSTRPMPRSRPSMSGAGPAPMSWSPAWRRRRRPTRRSSGSRRSSPNIRSRRAERGALSGRHRRGTAREDKLADRASPRPLRPGARHPYIPPAPDCRGAGDAGSPPEPALAQRVARAAGARNPAPAAPWKINL